MNKIVLNKLVARGCDILNETDYAILIDMITRIEHGDSFTSQELADNNYVSPAFVSRLCKKLGFGFRELKQHISDELNNFRGPMQSQRTATPGNALKYMLSEGIDQMLESVEQELPSAIEALHDAQHIVILGTGTSHIIAQYLA